MKKFNSKDILTTLITGKSDENEMKKLLINSKRWRNVLTSEKYLQHLKGLVVRR